MDAETGMSDAAAELLREWFAKGEARAEIENASSAQGWCVVTTELVHGDVNVYKFDQPAAALEYAAAASQALNKDIPSEIAEWSVKVVPLLPP